MYLFIYSSFDQQTSVFDKTSCANSTLKNIHEVGMLDDNLK